MGAENPSLSDVSEPTTQTANEQRSEESQGSEQRSNIYHTNGASHEEYYQYAHPNPHQPYQNFTPYPALANATPPQTHYSPSHPYHAVPIYPQPTAGYLGLPNQFTPSFSDQAAMMGPPAAVPSVSVQQNTTPVSYPTVYVTGTGVITVLLHYDVAVEMTVHKSMRLVNHRHKAVAATNSRGNVNCLYHVAGKAFQDRSRIEVELFGERRARLQNDGVLFGAGMEVYLLDNAGRTIPSPFTFIDLSKDCSFSILSATAWEITPDILYQSEEISKAARFLYHKQNASTTIINGARIYQDEYGDVTVTSGSRALTTSPIHGSITLQTPYIEASAQVNWNVSVKRGSSYLQSTYSSMVVSNGSHEAGFDRYRTVFSRAPSSAVSEFESWLPSLTYLCQGLPGVDKSLSKLEMRYSAGSSSSKNSKNCDETGDHHSQ